MDHGFPDYIVYSDPALFGFRLVEFVILPADALKCHSYVQFNLQLRKVICHLPDEAFRTVSRNHAQAVEVRCIDTNYVVIQVIDKQRHRSSPPAVLNSPST